MRRILLTIAGLAWLTGCAAFQLVEPGRVEIRDAFSVETPIAWTKLVQGKRQNWTVDGYALDALRFYAGLKKGDTLLERSSSDEDTPTFHPEMKPHEVLEFVVDSLAQAGLTNVETSGLRPAPFGELEGYRFELAYYTHEGLSIRGLGLAAIEDERLHLILYTAAATHYFDKHRDDVERMFGSIAMI